jgi:competence protein ComEC
VTRQDYSIAVIRQVAAFAEDCAQHNLIIARIRPPAYCQPTGDVIGPAQLAAGGVHWLHWDEAAGRFDIRPAISSVSRPWRVLPP